MANRGLIHSKTTLLKSEFHMFIDFSMPGGAWSGALLPGAHGGGDGGAGLVGVLDNLLTALTNALEPGSGTGSGGGPLAGIIALGYNVHPMVVHFPIAFIVAFFLLEIAGAAWRRHTLKQLASGMLYLGAAGSVLAVVAGLIAEDRVPHGAAVHEIMEWHERLGITVAVLTVGMAVWRYIAKEDLAGMAQALHLFLAGIIVACLTFGTDLGGLMVYQYGVGVQSLQLDDEHHHPHDADTDGHDADAGRQGSPMATPAGGQPTVAPTVTASDPATTPSAGAMPGPGGAAQEPTAGHHHHHHHHH